MARDDAVADAVEETFHERAPFASGMSAAATSAGAGLLVSAVQNSLQQHSHGALGVFTRTGGTIALFTAVGAVFAYTDATSANLRQKSDAVNGAAGGCAAGLVIGARARSLPMMVGSCAGLAALVGTFDAAGKSLTGSYAHPTPVFGAHAKDDGSGGVEVEEPAGIDSIRGTWRQERERRRTHFFKQKKDGAEVESE